MIAETLLLLNAVRVAVGLHPLQESKTLDAIAQAHAQEICETSDFSHDEFRYFMASQGGFIGENLAKGYETAQSVTNAWVASPEHLANMLDKNFTKVGFGIDCNVVVEEFEG